MAYPNGMVIGNNLYEIIQKYFFGDYDFEEVDRNYIIDSEEKYHVYTLKSRLANIPDILRNNELLKFDHKRSNVFSSANKLSSLSTDQKQTKESGRNVLIVDDEPDALFTYKTFLVSDGFNVDAFTGPEEALKIFATRNPSHYSLVIVDIRMPRLNGLQLYHRLRQMSMSAKVLFVSALDAAEELVSILPDSSDIRVIKKPADQNHFMDTVRDLLSSHDK
jgi:CheY-like chemotaxis protein